MFVECFQLNTLLMSVIDRTELTSNVPNKLVYGMRKKFPHIYILAYLPVILLEIVLLSKEVYKMFETGKKNFHQNSKYLECHSSEMLLLSLTYNTSNQMNTKHNKII